MIKRIFKNPKVHHYLPYIWLVAGIVILGILALSYIGRHRQGGVETLPSTKNQSNSEPLRHGVYEWRDFRYVNEDTYDNDLALAHEHGFNTLFLSLNSYMDLYEQAGAERDAELHSYETQLERFVQMARDQGFRVEALAGDMTWSDPELYYISETILQFVSQYNSKRPLDLRLQGMQFDVEPYNLSTFKERKEHMLREYIQYVEHMYSYRDQERGSDNTPILMGFAVPFWYEDGENGGAPIMARNRSDYAIYHILDVAHQHGGYIVIMAYRNTLEGKDGVFEHIKSEFDYAVRRAENARILVGQEVSEVRPEKLTYADNSLPDLIENLGLIQKRFENNPVFGGITVNDFEALSKKF